jgi:protein-S-isoprenylcysteine O-methyltransferase Ste14
MYLSIAALTILWFIPFISVWRKRTAAEQIDRRARWGILLEFGSYALIWQGPFWTRSPRAWQVVLAILLLLLACLLSWTSTRSLGRQFRLEAALGAEHQLVTQGPYRFIRHPIYASMLCLLLGTAILLTPLYLFVPAIVVFLIGTAIRIRIEDRLLAKRFGEQFENYRRSTSRLIPFVI